MVRRRHFESMLAVGSSSSITRGRRSQALRKGDALAFSAGELVDRLFGQPLQAGPFQALTDP